MVTHCSTEEDRQAIKKLCRINEKGQLAQLVQDFSFRRRELIEDDPLRIAYVDLDAKEVGRAAEHLLGISADEAIAMARKTMHPDARRELAIEMIHEVDQRDRADNHRPQQHTSVVKPMSAVDRANRHAALHRNKRRASA